MFQKDLLTTSMSCLDAERNKISNNPRRIMKKTFKPACIFLKGQKKMGVVWGSNKPAHEERP